MRFLRCATWIVVFESINSILAILQFVEQPTSDTITEGQTYVLTCKLNELVNCTWNRNDALTTITDRYRYVSNNGTNTKDCSFEIVTTSAEFDAASWQCTADNRDGIVHSDKVFLVAQRNMNQTQLNVWIVEQPKNASVEHGQNHTLTCKFNEPVDCIWTRSHSAVEIKDRYQYLNNNGVDSKDCSFRITNFGHADAAPWQCTARHGPGKYYTKEAVSNVVFLSTLSVPSAPLKLVEQPKNETVDPGQVHTLYCTFNAPINCSWDRNGTDIVINGRYSYISNNGINTKDCSFQISSFLAEFDAHVWKCKAFDPYRGQVVASDNVFLTIQRNTHYSRSTLGITEAGVKVVEQPTSVTVNEGGPAVLDCKFSEPVDCAWNPTNVNSQYHYVSNNGKHTKDCSIKIINVTTADGDTWECNGKVISDVKRIVSNKVNLHVRNQHFTKLLQTPKDAPLHATYTDIPLVKQPQNASVFVGHDHHLVCIYSMSVECSWSRNGIPVTIEGRYHFGNDNGKNTANCSLLITNFKTDHDDGYWECKAEVPSDINLRGLSDKAFLSVQNIVSPNRTAILLNGNPVTEIWVPTNGSQNGTLQCIAEYAIPQANLYWNVTGKIYSEGSPDTEMVCSQSCYCNSTLTWIGDWKQLLNSNTLSCFVLQLNSSTIVTASLLKISDNSIVSSSSLSAGAIAGIVIAVLLLILIIIGILVYFFVMKPRKTKNVQHNVTMAPSYDKNSGTIDIKPSHPSPAISEKANSTPGNSAETVRMNDRQPQAVPQSPVKVPLIKKVEGESRPNNITEDSDDEAVEAKPDLNTRYSTRFAYIGGKDIFPVKKMDGNQT